MSEPNNAERGISPEPDKKEAPVTRADLDRAVSFADHLQENSAEAQEAAAERFARALAADEQRRTALHTETRRTVLEKLREKYDVTKLLVGLAVAANLTVDNGVKLGRAIRMSEEDGISYMEAVKRIYGEPVADYGRSLQDIGAMEVGYAIERTGRDMSEGPEFASKFAQITDYPALSAEAAKLLAEKNGAVRFVYMMHESGYAETRTEEYGGDEKSLAARRRIRTTELAAPRSVYAEFDAPPGLRPGIQPRQKDQFGNEIKAFVSGGEHPRVTAYVAVDTEKFVSGPANDKEFFAREAAYSISVDFSALGGPVLERLVEGWAMRPEYMAYGTMEHSYPVYIDSDSKEVSDALIMALYQTGIGDDMGKRIADTESAFGLKPGVSVKRMVITGRSSDLDPNATYSEQTVVFAGEDIPEMEDAFSSDVVDTASHEALHAVDAELGVSESLSRIHAATSPELFKAINESEFLHEGSGNAGHSQDNVRELFASILNGAMATDSAWERGVQRMPAHIRKEYKNLLAVVQNELSKIISNDNSPIMALLKIRLTALTAMETPGSRVVSK